MVLPYQSSFFIGLSSLPITDVVRADLADDLAHRTIVVSTRRSRTGIE